MAVTISACASVSTPSATTRRVVNGNADAECLDALQGAERRLGVGHQRRFGDLEHDLRAIDTGRLQGVGHGVGKARMRQLHR